MKEIELYNSELKVIVDDEDYEYLNQFEWGIVNNKKTGQSYVCQRMISIHRKILGDRETKGCIDHINGNTLDNRRCNLRKCTFSENLRNQKIRSTNTSGFKGVSYTAYSRKNPFKAQICVEGKRIFLGNFSTAEKAAKAYDKAAKKYHGKFARLNFSKNIKSKIHK